MPEQLVHFDQQLLLTLNGSDSTWLDQVFLLVTRTTTWVPLIVALLYVLLRNRPWREVLFFVVCVALVVCVTDRFSSGFCKPFFHRFRPSHEPALEGLVDLVGDRRGGLYGFISSHAANTFGAFAFISLCFRRHAVTWTLLLWALLSSYSRIYLGLHYPGDILFGALWGLLTGVGVYTLWRVVTNRTGFCREPRSVSPQAVQSLPSNRAGFADQDVRLLPLTLAATLVVVAVLACW